MKLAIPITGNSPEASIDPRFGRSANLLIIDSESGEYQHYSNEQNQNAPQGAGIQTAQRVAELGADAVIAGHVGPKAEQVLRAAGIAIYACEGCSAATAVERFKAKALSLSNS